MPNRRFDSIEAALGQVRGLVDRGEYQDAEDLLTTSYQMIDLWDDPMDPELQQLLAVARRLAGKLRAKMAPGMGGAWMGGIHPDVQWHDEGGRYSVRVGDALWYDQGQYHGVADVEIKDNVTGEIWKRRGDVKIIGNFSPIWVNFKGHKILIEQLLRFENEATETLEARAYEKKIKDRGFEPGPREWLPGKKKKVKK